MANFSTNQKYLDLTGLQSFWTKVKAYILTQGTKIEASHANVEGVDKVWVNVTAGEAGANGITYTIDDTAINTKFTGIDNKLTEIEANAGVTGIKIVDADNTDESDFVKLTYVGTKDKDGNESAVTNPTDFVRGDVTVTLDNSKLNQKVTALDTADSNEAASRKADVELLAGDKYTAGAAGAVGSWAAEGSPKYKSITDLSNRLAAIDANLVTDIKEGDSKETYVALSVTPSTEDAGDHSVTITIDDTTLSQKVNSLESADATETAARKAADSLLAGAQWDADKNTWKTDKPAGYYDITSLSVQMKAAEASISALSNAVQFLGVSSTEITNNGTQKPTIDGSEVSSLEAGDVVFYGNKEFIWDGAKWVELGDTTVENQRLADLEGWVANNAITEDEIAALFA